MPRNNDAMATVEAGFRDSTIEDMLGDPARAQPLLCNAGAGAQARLSN